jgi:hypothetical protein
MIHSHSSRLKTIKWTCLSKPIFSDTRWGRTRRLEIGRSRAALKRNMDDRILPVDAHFHHQPTFHPDWNGPPEETREEKNAKIALAQLRSFNPPVESCPFGRQYDQPEDPINADGFLFPSPQYHAYGESD